MSCNLVGVGLAGSACGVMIVSGMRDRRNQVRWVLLFAFVMIAGLVAAVPSWAALPDGRVDELVSNSGAFGEPDAPASPFDSQQAEVWITQHPFEASEDGEAITYAGEPGSTGGTGELGNAFGSQWLARRTPRGWETSVITPESVDPEEPAPYTPYEAFLPDLTAGFLLGRSSGRPFNSEVPQGCRSLYLRETATGDLRALVTPAEAPVETSDCGRPMFAGATTDASKVIFQSEAALTLRAQEATAPTQGRHETESGQQFGEGCMFACNLYEASAGHLLLINVLPNGETVPNAAFGGYPGPRGGRGPNRFEDFSNVISADGSTVFWTDTQAGPDLDHVYALESGHSVQVSGAGAAKYWTATPDGRYAYYTEAGRLWRFDTDTNTAAPLTPEAAGVEGVVATNQTGEDGSYVYFVASAALAPGSSAKICTELYIQSEEDTEAFEEGRITEAEELAIRARIHEELKEEELGGTPAKTGCNLYLQHENHTALIAVLSPNDNRLEGGGSDRTSGDWQPGLGERTAEVTPDGENLLFESKYPLTGYHNLEATRRTIAEAFVYSASDSHLVCASCDPTGAPPTVEEAPAEMSRLPVSLEDNTYMHRWISSDGDRVFFDSQQPLSPSDQNITQDVYEWEREGTAGCPSATSVYGGCVYLLSGGTTETDSFLVDADATGDNVFFEHVGSLGALEVPFGQNELYDARVDGGFTSSSSVCTGDTCQGIPPAAPSFEPPATATSSSGSNYLAPATSTPPQVKPAKRLTNAQRLAKALKTCRKVRERRKRESCERQARKHYAPAHKATTTATKPHHRERQP
jgi:hypothetical protein